MNEEQLRAEYEREMQLRAEYEREMGGVEPSQQQSEQFIEEMHPEVSTADRLLAKNFANNDEVTMQFLQTRYPNMEVVNQNGRIYMKGKGEKQYRAFDPEGWGQYIDSPMEALRDVGDVVTDVGAGVAEAGAAAAAAAAAIPTTGGLGSIPAAMAAGGATGSGIEYLRQNAGRILGLPQETDLGQVGMSGAVGAVSPLMFGTGAAVKGAGKSAVRSQRGLVERGYDAVAEKVLPGAVEMASGIPKTATKTYANKMNVIDELEKDGVLGYSETVHDDFVTKLGSIKQQTGKRLENALTQAGQKVDIAGVKKLYRNAIDDAKANMPKNDESARLIQSMQDKFDELFTFDKPTIKIKADGSRVQTGSTRVEMPDQLAPGEAFSLQDQLRDAAELFRVKDGPMPRFSQSASRADKKGMEAARKGYAELNKEFDRVTSGLSTELKSEYKNLADLQKNLQPYFKDANTTFNTLSKLGNKTRRPLFETLERLQKSYNIDLMTPAKELEAFSHYGNFDRLSKDAISSGGTTSTSRSLGLGALGGAAGYYAGSEMGGGQAGFLGSALGAALGARAGSPAAMRALVRGGKSVDDKLQRFTPSARKLNTASNAWFGMDD
jgi:hypothetical protein